MALGILHLIPYVFFVVVFLANFMWNNVNEEGFTFNNEDFYAGLIFTPIIIAGIGMLIIFMYPILWMLGFGWGIKTFVLSYIGNIIIKYKFKTKNDFKSKRTIIIGDEVLEVIDE